MRKNLIKTGLLCAFTACMILVTVNTVNAETLHMEVKKEFDKIESLDEIAEKIETSNGEYLYADDIEILEEYWEPGFELPVVCYHYGSDFYYINEDEITIEESDLDEIIRKGDDFLKEAGLDPEKYIISEALWEGEPYENEDGILCRSLLLRGDKYVADYVVTYSGNVTVREYESAEAEEESTLETEEEVIETEEKVIETEETIIETEKPNWFDKLKKLFAILTEYKKEIMIGFSVIALIIIWLIILRYNRKHQS